MLPINERTFEREIDKSGDDLVLENRNLAQQQRHARGRLQQFEAFAHRPVDFVDLVEEQKARDF